jgi:hypothetical protein
MHLDQFKECVAESSVSSGTSFATEIECNLLLKCILY